MAKGTNKSKRAQKIEPVSLGELIHTQDPAPGDALRGGGRAAMDLDDELKRTWTGETLLDRQEKTLEGTTPQLTGKYVPVR